MAYELQDIAPANSIFKIDSTSLELSLITLKIETIFIRDYKSLGDAISGINKNPLQLLEIVWVLLIDKKKFQNDIEKFKHFCFNSKEGTAIWANRMNKSVDEVITNSMPLIKNRKRYNEIQEIQGSTEVSKPCYATYFDNVAKRYGYSMDQFLELTMRQLHIFLNTINDESYKELETQAALQGKKLKPRMEFTDVSEEQEKTNEDQAMAALKELQKKYKEKNQG